MSDGGGYKQVKFNTRERLVSTDQNRAQTMKGADLSELFRYLVDVDADDELGAGAVVTEHSTLDTPLRAEILNGLLVRPQTGTFGLTLDGGVMMALAPDAAPDESNLKFIHDPGISDPTVVTMSTNAGGSDRIDIIEVQVSKVVVETDNRDIYNPITNMFNATNVTKATQYTCGTLGGATNMRVRQGVVGGGLPALASGWLPLAVARVPPAAATNADITFWDVRPLLSDRERQPFNLTNRPRIAKCLINAANLAAATGYVDAPFQGRRLGGRLRRGSPGADADTIALSAAANQESTGAVFVANRPWYLYLATPFGLPRWARYTATPPHLPRSPRGIPIVSVVAPDLNGVPSAPITMPTSTGLVGTTQSALCVAAGFADGNPTQRSFFATDEGCILSGATSPGEPIEIAAVLFGVGNTSTQYTLTPGTHYPLNATRLLCEFRSTFTAAAGVSTLLRQVLVKTGVDNYYNAQLGERTLRYTGGETVTDAVTFWLDIPTTYAGAAVALVLTMAYGTTLIDGHLRILGWKLT